MGRKTQIALRAVVVLLARRGRRRLRLRQLPEGQDRRGRDDRRRRRRRHGRRRSRSARCAAQLLAPLRHSLEVSYDGETWTLPGEKLKVRADIDEAVEEAVDESQEGGLPEPPGPLRQRRRASTKPITADVDYSKPAINRFVRHVAEEVNREPQDASVEPERRLARTSSPARTGRKLRDDQLTEELERRGAERRRAAHTIVAQRPHDQAGGDDQGGRRRVPVLPDPRPRRPSPCGSGRT